MPAATQAGVFGIGELPSAGPGPRSAARSRGGLPTRVQRVSLAWPSRISSAGIVERVCSRTVRACSTSSRVVVPTRNFSRREGQHAFLNPDVVSRDLDPLLGDPILHVIRGHVGEERDERRVVILHGCIQTGVGRLDVPAEAAP